MAGIVVIGAGQAGSSLVATLREQGYDGALTLVGEEPFAPYQRPPLSKAYLSGEMTADRLLLRPHEFYSDNNIDLRLGTAVTSIDTAARTVSIGGETLGYDQLALTTGSAARLLPDAAGGNLGGVYVARAIKDIDRFAPEFVAGRKVLIVGGGYIGLEAAAVAAKAGLDVTLIEAGERILQRVAAPQTSQFFRALHQSHGVTIRENLGLVRLAGADRVTTAELSDGSTMDVDFVLVGIGIVPRTELAQAAGLAVDNGIVVDAHGRTSDPAVWAAGDCANMPWGDSRVRFESVPNAIHHAETAARNMLGANETHVPKPWFWSDQYDVKLQIAGLNAGYTDVVTRGDTSPPCSFWYYTDGRLLAVDAINEPRAFMIARRLIEAGVSPDSAVIADPQTDLKRLLA